MKKTGEKKTGDVPLKKTTTGIIRAGVGFKRGVS